MTSFRRSLALDRRLGDQFWEAHALEYIGDTHQETGPPDSAREMWREAAEILKRLGNPEVERVRAKLTASSPEPGQAC